VAARGTCAADEAADHWITASAQAKWTAAFVERLRELGWVEGQTVAIEYRWVEGRFERSPAIIAEFVRLKVDVIVTNATPNVVAAKQVTSVIPIVFPSAGDPVGTGLVASLARPGGNVTGLSVQSAQLVQKLPAMCPYRDYVDAGGLMAYTVDLAELLRRMANDVHQILNGVKPGDIPIYQPTKFELLINLKTANAFGLTLPHSLLSRADEVIE
jgi:ABC-type uncharacterized transport system substrate-binding protein